MPRGEDSAGKAYASVNDLWSELGSRAGRKAWFAKGTSYWKHQKANMDGIMGGFPQAHAPDIVESICFVQSIFNAPDAPATGTALDCGAGIGRVTVALLQHVFERVDISEPNKKYVAVAKQAVDKSKLGRIFTQSAQNLKPEPGYYDTIWIQWMVMYIPDDDLVPFLQRCAVGLKSGGVIVIKDNVLPRGRWTVDRNDNSITRTDAMFKAVFEKAGMTVVRELDQKLWPKGLQKVKMYALRPRAGEAAAVPLGVEKKPAMASSQAATGPLGVKKKPASASLQAAARPLGVKKRPASAALQDKAVTRRVKKRPAMAS